MSKKFGQPNSSWEKLLRDVFGCIFTSWVWIWSQIAKIFIPSEDTKLVDFGCPRLYLINFTTLPSLTSFFVSGQLMFSEGDRRRKTHTWEIWRSLRYYESLWIQNRLLSRSPWDQDWEVGNEATDNRESPDLESGKFRHLLIESRICSSLPL